MKTYLKIVYIMIGYSGVHICNVISLSVHVQLSDIYPLPAGHDEQIEVQSEGEQVGWVKCGKGCSCLRLPHLAAHA